MGDFSQLGSVPTLHQLGGGNGPELERDILAWSEATPLAVVIPTLYEELEREALPRIMTELSAVPYLSEVIIGLDGADANQFAAASAFFADLPMRHHILWHDGPALRAIDDELDKLGLATTHQGKGRNVWYCLGYFLASGRADIVALHDADVSTYSRTMLARLLYPIAHPEFGYAFAKGYYYRTDGSTINGRVSRLLVAPLLRALTTVLGPDDFLHYLSSFRYPLAGEFAMRRQVASTIRIPSDWGVEIGVLGEVYRYHQAQQVCQVDIAEDYDHKHQPLSADDPNDGLHKMAIDIASALFLRLASRGTVLSAATIRTIRAAYLHQARDLVGTYHHDAALNGLHTNPHLEQETVDVFATAIDEAGGRFQSNPEPSPLLASWSQVASAMPDVLTRLHQAVEADAESWVSRWNEGRR
jgi:glucosyl-3-phosphoglycerate synthase